MELGDTPKRKRVGIVCVQETKWTVQKSREIGNTVKNYGIVRQIKIGMERVLL